MAPRYLCSFFWHFRWVKPTKIDPTSGIRARNDYNFPMLFSGAGDFSEIPDLRELLSSSNRASEPRRVSGISEKQLYAFLGFPSSEKRNGIQAHGVVVGGGGVGAGGCVRSSVDSLGGSSASGGCALSSSKIAFKRKFL
ncbi:hypothetical protein M9H77_28032 [Catharanthus roseus]|uniref:Uncharacterized protein n=1 Tax=Catharanthus roseus TaxID=4058 RepID=A0ACC0AF43_CATRO|nr:hypothetical protein M9H77_28032 [Catharanthus roseus]